MQNTGLDEAQAGIKVARRNINNLRYADDTTLMAESEEELKSLLMRMKGFLGGLAGKESTCNAGHSGSISGSGRSAGEGIGYPFQYSWASLVAQLVKSLPTIR